MGPDQESSVARKRRDAQSRDGAILENLPVPVLIVDDTAQILWGNPSVGMLGLDRAASPSAKLHDNVAHADSERVHAAFAAALAQCGEPQTVKAVRRILGPDRAAYFDETLTYLPDTPGICGVLVVAHPAAIAELPDDVTALQGFERGLRQNEERLRQVVRLSGIGIFDHDHIADSVYWSPEQREIYGWGMTEEIRFSRPSDEDSGTWDVIHPQDRDRVAAAVAHAHGDPTGQFDIEYRIIRRDGSLRWITTRSQTFFAGQGASRRPLRTIGAVQDITDRRLAERELRLTQASVDRANTSIYWISPAGQVTYANEHACKSLGLSREELFGLYVWDFDPDFSPEKWAGVHATLLADRFQVTLSRHRRKDGTFFPVEAMGSYVLFDGEAHVFVFAQDITERLRSQREVQLLNAAVNSSRTPFFTATRTGAIIYANEQANQSLGLTREELLGSHIWDIDPSVSTSKYDELWKLLKNQGMLTLETRHRRKDGTLIPVEVTTSYFSFGGEEYSLSFAQDVTERQKIELALRQSQERLQQVIQVYDIGIFEDDHTTGELYWSPELRKAWRLAPDQEPSVWIFRNGIHPDDTPRIRAAVEAAYNPAGDGRFEVQMRVTRHDGEQRWMDSRSKTFFEGEGEARRPIRTVGAMVDITERHQVDEALRAGERRLREAQTIAQLGGWELDLVTNVITWSDEIFALFEVDPAHFKLSYDAILMCVHPEDRERVDTACKYAMANHTPYQITHRLITPSGKIKHIEVRGASDHSSDGTEGLWRGTSQDVTARVESEIALRQSLQEKETLLREVHHRVKNNLQIIASLLHFQAKQVRDPTDLAAFTDGRNRLRAMILVHEKLYQARDLSHIDFGGYLRALVRDLQYAHSVGQRLDIQIDTETVSLPIQLATPCGMIVCELLTNVFKYAFPDGRTGTVRVSLGVNGNQVRLEVADNGVGLPASFDPQQGSSFGWQLIRNLTAQLGGTVSVNGREGTQAIVSFSSEGV